jgi:hypothetical protein
MVPQIAGSSERSRALASAAPACDGRRMTNRFDRFELHTTDVGAARAFYEAVIGRSGDGVVEISAEARARGARPHWEGSLSVRGDLARHGEAMIARGASLLGPQRDPGVARLRDPGGAVVALTSAPHASQAGVVWHHLNALDAERTLAAYVDLLGWAPGEAVDLGPLGTFRELAFAAGEPAVGSVGEIAGRAERHPHWCFYFAVRSLDAALAAVRAQGGLALEPVALPNGARVAACDDPQGAAFGLMQLG